MAVIRVKFANEKLFFDKKIFGRFPPTDMEMRGKQGGFLPDAPRNFLKVTIDISKITYIINRIHFGFNSHNT